MKEINLEDEFFHPPDKQERYRESYYFNWVDPKSKVSGFTTIGILPNVNKMEYVFLLFIDDDLEVVHYHEPETVIDFENDINDVLNDGKLSYSLKEPLKKWRIELHNDEIDFEIDFNTRFVPFDFGKDSSKSWHGHFEASGIINGKVNLLNHEQTRLVKGFGQRDKSWGYRNWHEFSKWYAGHIQFEKWALGFRKDYSSNSHDADLSGALVNDKGIHYLKSLEIDTITEDSEDKNPISFDYKLKTDDDIEYNVKSKLIGEDTSFRFARNFDKGFTELYEQMVIMEDKSNKKKGSGMSELLRTHLTN